MRELPFNATPVASVDAVATAPRMRVTYPVPADMLKDAPVAAPLPG